MDRTDTIVVSLVAGGDVALLLMYLWALWSDRSERRQDDRLSRERQFWHATETRPADPEPRTRRLPRGIARVIEMREPPDDHDR